MKDELTLEMHAELIGDEIPLFDLKVMGVYGRIRRGKTLDEALKRYGLTADEYHNNIKRVLSE